MPEKRIFAKTGHVCMICGFRARTKNKYRELQDHLVRQHFQERIKAALPAKRPFVCPDGSCSVEGKDWQALMRHYTGKHGVLEAYLKEVLATGLMNGKESLHIHHVHRGHPSKLQQNRAPRQVPSSHSSSRKKKSKESSSAVSLMHGSTCLMSGMDIMSGLSPSSRLDEAASLGQVPNGWPEVTQLDANGNSATGQVELALGHPAASVPAAPMDVEVDVEVYGQTDYHTLEVDDTELAEHPTHLALVLRRPRPSVHNHPDEVGDAGLEETYAFVDLKCFMPVSANKYVMKSHVDLDQPGVAFTLPRVPFALSNSFLSEADPAAALRSPSGPHPDQNMHPMDASSLEAHSFANANTNSAANTTFNQTGNYVHMPDEVNEVVHCVHQDEHGAYVSAYSYGDFVATEQETSEADEASATGVCYPDGALAHCVRACGIVSDVDGELDHEVDSQPPSMPKQGEVAGAAAPSPPSSSPEQTAEANTLDAVITTMAGHHPHFQSVVASYSSSISSSSSSSASSSADAGCGHHHDQVVPSLCSSSVGHAGHMDSPTHSPPSMVVCSVNVASPPTSASSSTTLSASSKSTCSAGSGCEVDYPGSPSAHLLPRGVNPVHLQQPHSASHPSLHEIKELDFAMF